MTVHSHAHLVDEPDTYADLIEFWRRLDEPLTQAELRELWHPRTPRIIVAARCFYAFVVLSTLLCLPMVARAVGHALQ